MIGSGTPQALSPRWRSLLKGLEGASLAEVRLLGEELRVRLDLFEGASWVEARVHPDGSTRLLGTGAQTPAASDWARALGDARRTAGGRLREALGAVSQDAVPLTPGWLAGQLRALPLAPWTLCSVEPASGAGVVAELRRPDHPTPWHVVVEPATPAHPEWAVAGALAVRDYPAGREAPPGTAPLRAWVLLLLQLFDVSVDGGRTDGPTASTSDDRWARTLTPAELAHFDEHGWLVVEGVVPPEQVQRTLEAIDWFLKLDPTLDAGGFYEILPYQDLPGFDRAGSNLELYQHQALWDNRQHPAVHAVFAQLWGRRDLWVSLDRVNVKLNARSAPNLRWYEVGFLHWDVDTAQLPLPFGLQGVLCLTDTTADMGGFRCVPGMHKAERILEWAASQPPDRDPRRPDPTGLEVVDIPAGAGDLIVWHHQLPHGNGENTTSRPRVAQYITMFPALDNPEARLRRIRAWRERTHADEHFEGDPLRREARHGVTAELTELGERLLGLRPWPGSARAEVSGTSRGSG